MTSPEPVPPQAITAAAVAIHDVDCSDDRCGGSALGHCYKLARAALEAAAADLAAAERVRLAGLGDDDFSWIEPDPEAPGHNRGVFDFTAAIAAAVVREREACAQLAEQVGAFYPDPRPCEETHCAHEEQSFASLLREARPAGNRAERNTP